MSTYHINQILSIAMVIVAAAMVLMGITLITLAVVDLHSYYLSNAGILDYKFDIVETLLIGMFTVCGAVPVWLTSRYLEDKAEDQLG